MNIKTKRLFMISNIILIINTFYGCSSILPEKRFELLTHPALSKTRILCTDCHSDSNENNRKPFEYFNHTSKFIAQHRIYASQEEDVCNICHRSEFCTECHTRYDQTPFNLKSGDRPDRMYPHIGDYIVRHKIDGRYFSDTCFKCHGRKNNRTCNRCHRK
ncbi:MAG: cytochrome C [Candidatus Firestonebacteria bacterium]|nr:cytochrome C [Candidatus Firestonebacteria bacterium]